MFARFLRSIASFSLLTGLGIAGAGCNSAQSVEDLSLAQRIEAAHGGEAWQHYTAFNSNITIEFGGKPVFEGSMTYDHHLGRVRLERNDGAVAVFDGQKAWVWGGEFPRARFHLLTWPYFAALPFKLDDPGAFLEPQGHAQIAGRIFETGMLTFADNVGDTPDDWYLVYADPRSNLIEAVAYIVTYGKSAEEANEDPHALVYSRYGNLAGAKIATEWTFYNWSTEEGVYGEPIGEARLSKVRFVRPASDTFQVPAEAVEDQLPPINQ